MNKALSREIDIAMSHRLAEVRREANERRRTEELKAKRKYIRRELREFALFVAFIVAVLIYELWLPYAYSGFLRILTWFHNILTWFHNALAFIFNIFGG